MSQHFGDVEGTTMKKFKALVMNSVEHRGRHSGSGVIIVNTENGRPLFIGKNALSMKLKAEYEKAAAFIEDGVGRLSYPNPFTSFETKDAYYTRDNFSVWQQDIDFEPAINQHLYVDRNSLKLVSEKNEDVEEIELMPPYPYYS